MFLNKIPFFVTISRHIKFGTVESLPDRRITTVASKLRSVLLLYHHRGFHITTVLGDNEFKPLRPWYPMLNMCAADEHVPDIERFIQTIKDSTRSTYSILPFSHVPRIMIIHLVKNSVFWMNAFQSSDGVSSKYSPRYILTGSDVTYQHHVHEKFGQYVQTHENHNNDMTQRTIGAICLGPSGNRQGSHWFMCLTLGAGIHRHRWTHLPMPHDVILPVNAIGRSQYMPNKLTYANRHGREIEDSLDELSTTSDDDSTYSPDDDTIASNADMLDNTDNNDNNTPLPPPPDSLLRVGHPDIPPPVPTGVTTERQGNTAVRRNTTTATPTTKKMGPTGGTVTKTPPADDDTARITGVEDEMGVETAGVEEQPLEQMVQELEDHPDQEIQEIHTEEDRI